METLKTAVIGTGKMGRNHVRVYSEISDLVGVADINLPSAQALATEFKTNAYKDFKEMLAKEKPDCVSVVVPTSLHAKIGVPVLEKCHALVEKPIALEETEAEQLIDASKKNGHMLMVGQIERFNPIVKYVKEKVKRSEYLSFTILRLGSYTPQVRTTGVILDLGIHDIDTVRFLTREEPAFVHASCRHVNITDFEDHAQIFLKMPSADASLISNWISPVKVRQMYAVLKDSFLSLDYVGQTVTVHKNGDEPKTIALPQEEPLKNELQAFLDAAKRGKPSPVNGRDALETVRVAQRALRIAYRNDPNVM